MLTTETKPTSAHAIEYIEIRALIESGKPEEIDLAVTKLSELANAGNVDSQVDLGFLLASGQAERRDMVQAAHWFEQAAKAGSGQAQFNYGVLLRSGQGVEVDLKRAAKYFHSAALQGSADAAFNYAVVLREAGGAKDELAEAIRLLETFADEQADLQCAYAAGLAATEGWVDERDLPHAVPYLRQAATGGHVSAAYNLALILYYGEDGIARDREEAKRLFEMAAQNGHDRARHALADPSWEAEA